MTTETTKFMTFEELLEKAEQGYYNKDQVLEFIKQSKEWKLRLNK